MADLGAVGETRQTKFNQNVSSAFSLNITTYPIGGVFRVDDSDVIFIERRFIRGYVRNSAGTGIARTVIAVREATKEIVAQTLSSAVDGAFTLRPSATDKCHVIAIPNVGDNRNAVILADIVPKVS